MRALSRPSLLAVAILIASSPLQAGPVHQWSKSFGDADMQYGTSVAMDGAGNVIVTGFYFGIVDLGGGPLPAGDGENEDMFVAKFDPSGNHLWSRGFRGPYGHVSTVVSSGNVIVAGSFLGTVDFGGGPLASVGSTDVFVAKFDASGNHVWSRSFGEADYQSGVSVATDASGNVVLTGDFYGSVDFGGGLLTSAGVSDAFVAKLNASGNHVWSRGFGDADHQTGGSVATDGGGDVLAMGTLTGSVDFGGDPLTGNGDIYLAKFDAGGNHIWSRSFGNGDGFRAGTVATDGSGNAVMSGAFSGSLDFGGGSLTSVGDFAIFLAKLDASGNHIWSRSFGDAEGIGGGNSVAADGSGNVVVTGWVNGSVDFGGDPLTGLYYDIFVAKFDASGNHVWSRSFGDAADFQQGRSVATDGSNVVVTGELGGSADFGGGPLTSAGSIDIFVAKFTDMPLPVLITRFEATARGRAVEIRWDVWSDEALESFTLYRGDDTRPQAVAIAEGHFGATTRSFVDASVEREKTYHYELVIRTRGGDDIRSALATVTLPRLEATLGQNFPNPFNPSTTIEYTLNERSRVAIVIFDASGALAARLDEGVRAAGTHRVEWDGRDFSGHRVGSGVYFYQLEGAPRTGGRKMVLLK